GGLLARPAGQLPMGPGMADLPGMPENVVDIGRSHDSLGNFNAVRSRPFHQAIDDSVPKPPRLRPSADRVRADDRPRCCFAKDSREMVARRAPWNVVGRRILNRAVLNNEISGGCPCG